MAVLSDSLLGFVQEPMFIVSPSAGIAEANPAARRLVGADLAGRSLLRLVGDDPQSVLAYLTRCSGQSTPLLGAMEFLAADRPRRMKTQGARVRTDDGEVLVALRCTPAESGNFSILATKVRELNAEVGRRRRSQTVLEEALRRNEMLLHELHHRVKNNIQLLLGLFSATQREHTSAEVGQFVDRAKGQLLAIGAAQQLMYRSGEISAVPAGPFMEALCTAISSELEREVTVRSACDDGWLSNEQAFPLALIANELITNAAQHGLRDDRAVVEVRLERTDGVYALTVPDCGPEFVAEAALRRSSGLGLVRGLCRQIDGTITIGRNANGAECTVRFAAHAFGERA